jgi:RNA polymerase sigma factor (sigma-70 family)
VRLRDGSRAGIRDGTAVGGSDALPIEALVREHRDAAVAYARRILGDADLAEDAVQRALLQIVLRVRGGDEDLLAANPRAVVLRGTRWAALKIADRHHSGGEAERRAAAESLVAGDDAEEWDRLEARLLVEGILPELPEHYRDVLRLRYLEGRPDAHAAEDLAVTVKAYRRRLDRALVVARLAAGRIGVTSLGAALPALLRRRTPGRSSAPQIAMAVAVVGFAAGPVGPRAVAPPWHPPPQTGAVAVPSADAPSRAAATMAPSTSLLHIAAPLHHAAPAGPSTSARGETPDDVQVTGLVPAPHASQNHTAVADGYGRRCACHVLLQTTDGGATWTIHPAAGDGVLLPPDYPRDPCIVFAYAASSYNTTMCIAARISDGTCRALPLTTLAATPVIDPAFDTGSPLIYSSTTAGVVSLNVENGRVRLLQANNGTNLYGVPLSAAGGSGTWAVYALVQGTPLPETTVAKESPVDSAPVVGVHHLVGCPHQGPCQVLGTMPGSPTLLVSDHDDPTGRVMVASDQFGGFDITTDAGHTVRTLSLPGQPLVMNTQLLGLPGGLRLSALLMHPGGHMGLATWDERSGWSLTALDSVAPPVTVVFQAALGGGRLILADSSFTGLRCSTDGGASWALACPAVR